MKNRTQYATENSDRSLCIAMRLIGAFIILASVFLLTHNYFHTPASMSFLGVSASLGTITLISSWFTGEEC